MNISYKIVDKYVHTLLVYPIGEVSGIYFQLIACSKIYPMPIDDPIRPFETYLSHCNLYQALCQDFKEVFAVFSSATHPTVVSLSFATATFVSLPTTFELVLVLELVCWQCLVTVSVQSSMVVTSTTVSETVLATFLGVEVGILSQVFSGTELQTG